MSLDTLLRGLETGATCFDALYLEGVDAVSAALSLHALVGRIVQQPVPLPVVDAHQCYIGAVTQTMLLQKMVELDTEEGHDE